MIKSMLIRSRSFLATISSFIRADHNSKVRFQTTAAAILYSSVWHIYQYGFYRTIEDESSRGYLHSLGAYSNLRYLSPFHN